ncbi:MAG: alpha/beta hydrolase [Chthoniobacterales bacterium]
MPTLKANNVELYYELEGSGKPLILIPGYACYGNIWSLIRRELVGHFKLLVIDNRDSGRSESSETAYTIDDMAEDVASLIQTLGLEKAHILGHSMGGAIAQTLAARHPALVDKLILSNTIVQFSAVSSSIFRWHLSLREKGLPPELVARGIVPWIFSNEFLSHPNLMESLIALSIADPYPQSLASQSRQFDALTTFNARSLLKNIAAPTLVIAGEEDICSPPVDSIELAREILNAQLVTIPKMAHSPVIECPEEFTRIVLSFLQTR